MLLLLCFFTPFLLTCISKKDKSKHKTFFFCCLLLYLQKKVMAKGCIYFFKHVGLDPIKIGFTTGDSPIDRFKQFGTYAPYGSEIVGFSQVEDPKKKETELHRKYSNKRLSGEWFDITIQEAEKEIKTMRSKEEAEKRNNFEIHFAKHLGITENIEDSSIEEAIFTLFDIPLGLQDGKWLTATEIQCMMLDYLAFECYSMKILGSKLRLIFGMPKFRDRQSKYFVKVK